MTTRIQIRPGPGRRSAAGRLKMMSRNLDFLRRRMQGELLKQIAHAWDCSVRTVRRGLAAARDQARKLGLVALLAPAPLA